MIESIIESKLSVATWWRKGWMRAWQKRKYPDNIKPFGRAWSAGIRVLAISKTGLDEEITIK